LGWAEIATELLKVLSRDIIGSNEDWKVKEERISALIKRIAFFTDVEKALEENEDPRVPIDISELVRTKSETVNQYIYVVSNTLNS